MTDAPGMPMRGERPQIPSGVAGGNGLDSGRPRGAGRGTIANGLGGVNRADLQDSRLQAGHGTHRIRSLRRGVRTVERDAGQAAVDVVVAAEGDRGSVAERQGGERQVGALRLEGWRRSSSLGLARHLYNDKVSKGTNMHTPS